MAELLPPGCATQHPPFGEPLCGNPIFPQGVEPTRSPSESRQHRPLFQSLLKGLHAPACTVGGCPTGLLEAVEAGVRFLLQHGGSGHPLEVRLPATVSPSKSLSLFEPQFPGLGMGTTAVLL